jgi:hypothetical protein
MTRDELKEAMQKFPTANTLVLSKDIAIDMFSWYPSPGKDDPDVLDDDIALLCAKITEEFNGIKVLLDPETHGNTWSMMQVNGMILYREDMYRRAHE